MFLLRFNKNAFANVLNIYRILNVCWTSTLHFNDTIQQPIAGQLA